MYGLVNRAIEELVNERAGSAAWEAVCRRAGNAPRQFASMQPYPDSLTYDLVAAASEVLQMPAEAVLRAFGRHWILFTAREGYGALLDAAGRDLRDFLLGLDALHARLAIPMPELVPPRFRVCEETDGTLRVSYASDRAGLAPMVLGLLEGLAERFEAKVRVSMQDDRDDDGHWVFRLERLEAS